jgi:uncharacterized protein YndB with AHSA1/START domain
MNAPSEAGTPGDQVTVTVLVRVPPVEAFRIFTEEIDDWWRGGLKYRIGKRRSVVHLEPRLGGRLFESFEAASGPKVKETGRVTCFEPPERLVFEWRATNFAAEEKTKVEVRFEPSPSGSLVTLVHRGWSQIRPDHPARHGDAARVFLRHLGSWWGELLTSFREHSPHPPAADPAIEP